MDKVTKDIKEEDKPSIVRKGNEFFNKGDYILAYQCYKMASYPSGIEKIGDFFYFTKHNPAKAIIFYKQALKEYKEGEKNDDLLEKIKNSALQIIEVLRKWNAEDEKESRDKITNKAYMAIVDAAAKNKFHTKDNGDKK